MRTGCLTEKYKEYWRWAQNKSSHDIWFTHCAEAVQSEYDDILNKIQGASILYVDETGIPCSGWKTVDLDICHTIRDIFRDSKESRHESSDRSFDPRFKGIIVCDGWKPYARFTNQLQRCWAYLLRESKDLSEMFEEAIPLHKALKGLYDSPNRDLGNDPLPEARIWQSVRGTLQYWIDKEYIAVKVRNSSANQPRFWLLVHVYHQSWCRANKY